jgi:hypothetical protein
MEWDAIGTFALFLSAGAVGVSCTILTGYRARLKANLEMEHMRRQSGEGVEELRREMHDLLAQQAAQLDELNERMDFAERLLTKGDQPDRAPEAKSTPV